MSIKNFNPKVFIGGVDKEMDLIEAIKVWKMMGRSSYDCLKHTIEFANPKAVAEFNEMWKSTSAMTVTELASHDDADVRSSIFVYFKAKELVSELDLQLVSEEIVPYTVYTWQENAKTGKLKRFETSAEHHIKLYLTNLAKFGDGSVDLKCFVIVFKDVSTDREFIMLIEYLPGIKKPSDAVAWMAKGQVAFRHGEVLFRAEGMKASPSYTNGKEYFQSLVLEA